MRHLVTMNPRAAALLLTAALFACGHVDDGTGIDQSEFVDVVVELRRAARSSPDPATFHARRQQILHDAGIGDAQLRAYVQAHSRDFEHMAAVWESINVRLSTPEQF